MSRMLIVLVSYLLVGVGVSAMNFYNDVDLTWGGDKAKIMENGSLLVLTLDKGSGSGFQSKAEYLFGRIDIKIKVVPGNSAGTVTAYYVSAFICFYICYFYFQIVIFWRK